MADEWVHYQFHKFRIEGFTDPTKEVSQLRVVDTDAVIPLEPKARRLLFELARAGDEQPNGQLKQSDAAKALWPPSPETTFSWNSELHPKYLAGYVNKLRKALGDPGLIANETKTAYMLTQPVRRIQPSQTRSTEPAQADPRQRPYPEPSPEPVTFGKLAIAGINVTMDAICIAGEALGRTVEFTFHHLLFKHIFQNPPVRKDASEGSASEINAPTLNGPDEPHRRTE